MSSTTVKARRVVIWHVRVFDGHEVEDHVRDVVMEGGLIAAAKASTDDAVEVVDGTGCTLLPELIDAHVHITSEEALRVLAAHGITTAMDMACWPSSKVDSLRAFSRREVKTEMRSAGLPATTAGSLHSKVLPELTSQSLIVGPR